MIFVSDCGVKSDGVNDDTVAFTNALNASKDSGIIYVPNGTYLLNDFTIKNKSITIKFESDKVVFISSGKSAIRFISDWTDVRNVLKINYTSNAVISCSDVSEYVVGDIVKIISEDIVPGYDGKQYAIDYGGNLRCAEYKTVVGVNKKRKELIVAGSLRYEYKTNVRIAKQGKHTLKILGGTLGFLSSPCGLHVTGGMNHEINVKTADHAEHTSIELEGTYGLKCDVDIGIKSNEHLGVMDRNSSHFTISYKSKNCRHPFTTGHPRFSTVKDFNCYGVSEYGTVEGSFVDGNSQAAFDSHEQAYKLIYRNSRCINNSEYIGIQVRGKENVYENMHIEANMGLQVTQGDRTDIGKAVFNNCTIESPVSEILKYNAEFNNCSFIFRDKNVNFYIKDSIAEFNNCKIYTLNKNSAHNMFRFEGKNFVRFNNLILVYGVLASNCKFLLLHDGVSDIKVNGLTVRSEVDCKSPFIAVRLQDKFLAEGSKVVLNNVDLESVNGLEFFKGKDDFNSLSAGLIKERYPKFLFEFIKR